MVSADDPIFRNCWTIGSLATSGRSSRSLRNGIQLAAETIRTAHSGSFMNLMKDQAPCGCWQLAEMLMVGLVATVRASPRLAGGGGAMRNTEAGRVGEGRGLK